MRADRLVAALLILQSRGRVTAAELAAELEVSVATARRDLEGLSAAGIPVYPQAGRGGGWQLLGGARTDLTGLTAGEAQALFLLFSAGQRRPPERSGRVTQAVAGVTRHLPAGRARRRRCRDRGSVLLGRSATSATWVHRPVSGRSGDAVVRRLRVRLQYVGRNGASTRIIDPRGLVTKNETWYLVAGTDTGRRPFRLDRVRAVTLTGDSFERPADLDVSDEWDEIVTQVESRRGHVTAQITAKRRLPVRQWTRWPGNWPRSPTRCGCTDLRKSKPD